MALYQKTVVLAKGSQAALDWTLLGHELRLNDQDAHGDNLLGVMDAYSFLLDNPECFTGGQNGWPEDMPQEPNLELIIGYTYWKDEDMEKENQ